MVKSRIKLYRPLERCIKDIYYPMGLLMPDLTHPQTNFSSVTEGKDLSKRLQCYMINNVLLIPLKKIYYTYTVDLLLSNYTCRLHVIYRTETEDRVPVPGELSAPVPLQLLSQAVL